MHCMSNESTSLLLLLAVNKVSLCSHNSSEHCVIRLYYTNRPQSSPRMERKKLTRTQTGLSSQIRTTTATLGDNVTVFKLPGVNMSVCYHCFFSLVGY